MTFFLAALLNLALTPSPAAADPQERAQALEQARQFLLLSPDAQKEFSHKLSAREAEALKSQILALRRAKNPDLASLDYVITQLATISALEVAQTRLNSLLWAIVLTFLLLIGFLAYVLYDQRRLAAALAVRPGPTHEASPPPATRSRAKKS